VDTGQVDTHDATCFDADISKPAMRSAARKLLCQIELASDERRDNSINRPDPDSATHHSSGASRPRYFRTHDVANREQDQKTYFEKAICGSSDLAYFEQTSLSWCTALCRPT